jgi:formylglycine-generating enzyme required for sulfatase activity
MSKRQLLVVLVLAMTVVGLTWKLSGAFGVQRDQIGIGKFQGPKLDQAEREAIVAAGIQAIAKHRKAEKKEDAPNEIDAAFWGEPISKLKPIRVRNDHLNAAIVLSVKDGIEEGLYVSNPISSYAAAVGDRFALMTQLSTEKDRSFGTLYHYKCQPIAQPKAPPKNFTNSIGMKFIWIPLGTFMMGSPGEEKPRRANETQHKVTLTKGFYMGVHLVTQEQWMEIMAQNPSHFKGEKNLPVEMVSWDDCQEFIKKLREKDKKPYRLPTEAEWEYSCRAGTTTPFHFGETISTDQANYNGEIYRNGKKGVNRKRTTPLDSFPPNALGLYDMHGNLSQWCQDRHGEYPQDDVIDPQGPEVGEARMLRGGSWFHNPQFCRSAFRYWDGPRNGSANWGLRVCLFWD